MSEQERIRELLLQAEADLRTPDAGTVSDRPGEDSAWTVDIGATCSRLVAAVKFGS